jgi:S-adenosylmethionine hydrolase
VTISSLHFALPLYSTYDNAKEEELFIIVGSANTFEFSVKNKSAYQFLIDQKKIAIVVGTEISID